MSAPTSVPGDGGPAAGYYPDPSIPGYVRYWNGAAWVPGTSMPAPPGSEAAAAAQAAPPAASGPGTRPAGAPPASVEETGPVFFDEDPSAGVADGPDAEGGPVGRQEPASVWQADTARQSGFEERDHRVAWGATGPDPRSPEPSSPAAASELSAAPPTGLTGAHGVPAARSGEDGAPDGASGARSSDPLPSRSVEEAGRHGAPPPSAPPVDSTVALRALAAARRAKGEEGERGELAQPAAPAALASGQIPAGEGAPRPAPAAQATPWAQQVHEFAQAPEAQAHAQASAQAQAAQAQASAPVIPAQASPPAQAPSRSQASAASPAPSAHSPSPTPFAPFGPGPSSPAGAEPPVVPWKPPKEDDPFQAAARAQASARPAGLGLRFLARLIDSVVVGAVVGAAAAPLALRARTHIDDKIEAARQSGRTVTVYLLDGTTGVYLAVAVVALLVVGVLYEALPTAKWGRTPGKKLCGLSVRDIESFEPPRFRAALTRWLVYGVLGLVVVGIVNVLWCVFDRPWRQCWHDKAARTFVAGRSG